MSDTIDTKADALEAPAFVAFDSIPRLSRDMIVTEKLDGTNAQVLVSEHGTVLAGSRSRWIRPGKTTDNFGFAQWVADHADELRALGPGAHYGEWWGAGIQRGYGLDEKRFSLFNVGRWSSAQTARSSDVFEIDAPPRSTQCVQVPCCHVVPVLARWTFDTHVVDSTLAALAVKGSRAAPGFMEPEGVVVFHTKSGSLYKKTLDKHDGHKSAAA
jgi:hypothetical protein